MTIRFVSRMFAALIAAAALAGCATMQPQGQGATRASRDDPFEPFNRAMYEVHQVVDGHFIRPIAQAYVDYTPEPVRQVVHNFFGNIDDFFTGVNGVLQNKPDEAGHSFGRVILNTFMGLGGMIDIASSGNIPKYELDFGQTFGVWGVPPGPYLFIPVLGPSDVRDGTGLIVRGYASPIGHLPDVSTRNILFGIGFLDARASVLGTEGLVEQASLDRYTFIRRAYLQRREYLITGKRPVNNEDD